MSDYNVIHDLSDTLRVLLNNRLNQPGRPVLVTVDSPHKDNESEPRPNLSLYPILQDEHRRNTGGYIPLEKAGGYQRFVPEPLAFKLFYLITAFAADGLSEHRLLGEAIQTLHKYPYIPKSVLQGSLASSEVVPDRIQLVLQNLDLEALNNIWGNNVALLRASVAYEVNIVFLDPADAADRQVRLVEEVVGEVVPVPYLSYIYPESAAPGDMVKIYGANLALDCLKIWFGATVVEPLEAGWTSGSCRVEVPADLSHGHVAVRLQLVDYFSAAREFEVLGGGA